MKKILLVLSLIALCGASFAATVTKTDDGYVAKGALYEAAVNDKGFLTSFKVGGTECFRDSGYVGNPSKAEEQQSAESLTRDGNKLLARGEKFIASYTFTDDNVKIDFVGEKCRYNLRFDSDKYNRWPDMSWRKAWVTTNYYNHFAYFPCDKYNVLVRGMEINGVAAAFSVEPTITLTPRVNTPAEVEKYNDMNGIASGALSVTSPMDYRVFQRATKYDGKVVFSGKTNGDAVR
ncbi:MAG: hypothetical protein IJT09_04815, partial [Abditibacteriota bacterium]|nr:hypothetical protein [Abditibacteriota bacterium]